MKALAADFNIWINNAEVNEKIINYVSSRSDFLLKFSDFVGRLFDSTGVSVSLDGYNGIV